MAGRYDLSQAKYVAPMARQAGPSATEQTGQYPTRVIAAFRYGSLAIAALGAAWGVVFGIMGWWGIVALDVAVVASGLSIYALVSRGQFALGLLIAQAVLIVIASVMALIIDVPTTEAPRVSHLYLLVVAALGFLNYQRQASRSQLALIVVSLLLFVVFASTPLANPFVVDMPVALHRGGTWANAIVATALLAGCAYAMQAELARNDRIGRDLISAMWNEEFHLVYQPQVDLDHRTVGAEALLRWTSPGRGGVPPASFIPQAERAGLMVAIGGWVLKQGCTTLAEWGKHPDFKHLTLSINVSASQILDDGFENLVRDTLSTTGADARHLILEMTESVLVTDTDTVVARLAGLQALGITIALDDFGTGYSSLAYLRSLPIQQIKIDRGFVKDMLDDPRSASLIKNVVQIGRDLGQQVLAEGVETSDQQAMLAQVGCVQFQGYFHGRPMEPADFEARIAAETKRAPPG